MNERTLRPRPAAALAAALAVALMAAVPAAHAQMKRGATQAAQPALPAYIGASIGQSRIDLDCPGGFSCDETDTGFKVFGGYMFTPNFGAELSYTDFGNANASASLGFTRVNVSFDGSAIALFGIASAPINEQFSVFGKLGIASFDTEVTGAVPGFGSSNESESYTSVAYGIGASFNVARNIAFRAEWERYRAKFDGEKSDVDLLSVGVKFRF